MWRGKQTELPSQLRSKSPPPPSIFTYFVVKRSYNELYKSVESGETRIALVDIFSTPQHSEYYDEYKLYVATVLNERVIYGAVLPMGTENIRKCFLDYHGNHQLEVHEILEKYINSEQVGDRLSS